MSTITWLSEQPFLVAGIGTAAASAAMYALRSIPAKVANMASALSVSTLEVSSRNDMFDRIDDYATTHIIPWTFRKYEPASYSEDDVAVHLNIGYGSGWGSWRGVLFSFEKSKDKSLEGVERSLQLKFLTHSRSKVEDFVNAAKLYLRETPRQHLYVSSGSYWERAADKRLRSLDTIFAPTGVVEGVVSSMENFLRSEGLYLLRGIPYKLVILLYGPPGTGKTSIIHAVASHFSMDIDYVTSLGNLGNLLSSRSNRRSVRVIEDIDTMAALSRSDSESDTSSAVAAVDRRSLHDAINTLDGFTTQHGLVLFITSNHPERLDPALLRPGRIDYKVEVGHLDVDAATRMFAAFYGAEAALAMSELAGRFAPITGAEMQQCLMRGGPAGAVEHIEQLWRSR